MHMIRYHTNSDSIFFIFGYTYREEAPMKTHASIRMHFLKRNCLGNIVNANVV